MKFFTKEWYLNGCKDSFTADKIPDENLPKWYNNFNIHDCKIISSLPRENRGEKLILQLDTLGGICRFNCLVFSDYLIKERCNILDSFCIADELYFKSNGRYEYHLLLQTFSKSGKSLLSYLTVNCKNMYPLK